MTTLLLASSSKYRQAQLCNLGLDIKAIAPDIDETPLSMESPRELASRLALAKAQHISKENPDAIVIGGDQVACINPDDDAIILGKPHNRENAIAQLRQCSGQKVVFYTALSLCLHSKGKNLTHCEEVTVHFKTLNDEQISAYIDKESPLDCAGSFKSEGLGVLLFSRITSRDPNTLVGLPVMLLRDMLKEFDIDLLSLATKSS